MRQKSETTKVASEQVVKDIRWARVSNNRPKRRSASCWMASAARYGIAELCRREERAESL